jgi:GMP synthase-like glutamine amidotransferase
MSNIVNISILNCPGGKDWGPIYTSYMNRHVKATHFSFEYTIIDVSDIVNMNRTLDELEFDGYAITGSTYDAYDNQDWILNLIDVIKNITHVKKKKLLGICFGHQIIGRALGGEVSLCEKGWGVGPRSIDLNDDGKTVFRSLQQHYQSIVHHAGDEVRCLSIESELILHYSHQDQVTTPPPDGVLRCVGGNDHCPFAASFLGPSPDGGDIGGVQVLTFQGHPEFPSLLMREIIAMLKDLGAYSSSGSGDCGKGASRLGYAESLELVEQRVAALCEPGENQSQGDDRELHSSAIGKCIIAFYCMGRSFP